MKKHDILTIAILAAFLGFSGCSEDSNDPAPQPNPGTEQPGNTQTSECTETSILACASATSKNVCVAGKVVAQNCAANEICVNNACAPRTTVPQQECTEASVLTCASETSRNVCVAGKIVAQNCGANEICTNNTCTPNTTVPQQECTEASVLNCASETSKNVCNLGKIEAQNCGENEICENNICKPKGTGPEPECTETSVLKCASETSRNVCDKGKITAQKCGDNEICENNACKPKGTGSQPECTETSVLTCASETSKNICDKGKIVAQKCGNNEACVDNKCAELNKPVKGGVCNRDTCGNNTAYYCIQGKYQVNEDAPCGDKVCEVTDGKNAFCLEPCTKENTVGRVCGRTQIFQFSSEATCKKFPDGKLAMFVDESSANESVIYCDNECENGECINQHEEVKSDQIGKDCTKSEFGFVCTGKDLLYCDTYFNKVAGQVCEKTCSYKTDPKDAYCVIDEGCTEGEVKYRCQEIDENTDRQTSYKCAKAHDGKFYMFGTGTTDCEAGSCKADGSCKPQ